MAFTLVCLHLNNILRLYVTLFILNAQPNFPEFAKVQNGVEGMEGVRFVQ